MTSTPEAKAARQEKIKAIRAKLASVTPEEKKHIAENCYVTTVEGHVLSPTNTAMLYFQSAGKTPTVVAGYNQWKKAGRQVKKGEHGSIIFAPGKNRKAEEGADEKDIFFFAVTVFDISQTEEITKKEAPSVALPLMSKELPPERIGGILTPEIMDFTAKFNAEVKQSFAAGKKITDPNFLSDHFSVIPVTGAVRS